MTLEQMQYFVELYQQKSITKAADVLHISRQALSQIIKKLEEEFQTELFSRLNNGIQPTDSGTLLYENALTVLSTYATLNYKMLSPDLHYQKKIVIGISDALMFFYGDSILDILSMRFPDITFNTLYATLQQYQEFDAYIYFQNKYNQPNIGTEYQSTSLKEFSTYVWLSASSPLCQHDIITREMVKDLTPINYRNLFSSTEYTKVFATNCPAIVAKSKNNFLFYMENDTKYFIADIPIINNSLIFENIFKNRKIVAKKMNLKNTLTILCKTDLHQSLLPVISEILTSELPVKQLLQTT